MPSPAPNVGLRPISHVLERNPPKTNEGAHGMSSVCSQNKSQPIVTNCMPTPRWAEKHHQEQIALNEGLKKYIAGFWEQAVLRLKQELREERTQDDVFFQDRVIMELGKTLMASSEASQESARLCKEVQRLARNMEHQQILLQGFTKAAQETPRQIQNVCRDLRQQAVLEATERIAAQPNLSQSALQPSRVEVVNRDFQQFASDIDLRMGDRLDEMQTMHLARLDSVFKELQVVEELLQDQAARQSTAATSTQEYNMGDPLVMLGKCPSQVELATEISQTMDFTKSSRSSRASPSVVVERRNKSVPSCLMQFEGYASRKDFQCETPNDENNRLGELLDDGPAETSTAKSLRYVNWISLFFVMLNTVFMGIHIDVKLTAIQQEKEPPHYMQLLAHAFTGSFVIEMIIRFTLEKMAFFTGVNARWNLFDAFLVILGLCEALQLHNLHNTAFARILRASRVVRAARALRTWKNFRLLRLIMDPKIWHPLFWGVGLLLAVVYLFAVCISTIVMDHTETNQDLPSRLLELYGSMGKAQSTLFMAVSGGEDWGELVKPLEAISAWNQWLFLIFMIIFVLGVLNTVSAAYVDAFIHFSNIDRDVIMTERKASEKVHLRQLRTMLRTQPLNAEGLIERKHLLEVLTGDGSNLLTALGLTLQMAKSLFRLLDVGDSHAVEVDEYIYGLLHLKGNATTIHLASLMYQSRRLMFKVQRLSAVVEDRVVPLLLGTDPQLLGPVQVLH